MRLLHPDDAQNENDLKEICFYWIQKSHMLQIEKEALLALLDEKKINISMNELLKKMNQIQLENAKKENHRRAN